MSIYTISDLHLAINKEKPMDIFGENWNNHETKIKENWHNQVKDADIVLLPGDFSWANTLEEAYEDFKYLEELPGKKILLKGNHDYWWNTITKMRNYLKEKNINSIDFLYNNSFLFEDYIITGTRGWINGDSKEDKKILNREYLRLKLSLDNGIQKYGEDKKIIVCMHYPPFDYENDIFINLMKEYNVEYCVYGHLHGEQAIERTSVENCNIKFKLVSCDYLNFELFNIKNL